jgi:hypothetical protein
MALPLGRSRLTTRDGGVAKDGVTFVLCDENIPPRMVNRSGNLPLARTRIAERSAVDAVHQQALHDDEAGDSPR